MSPWEIDFFTREMSRGTAISFGVLVLTPARLAHALLPAVDRIRQLFDDVRMLVREILFFPRSHPQRCKVRGACL